MCTAYINKPKQNDQRRRKGRPLRTQIIAHTQATFKSISTKQQTTTSTRRIPVENAAGMLEWAVRAKQ